MVCLHPHDEMMWPLHRRTKQQKPQGQPKDNQKEEGEVSEDEENVDVSDEEDKDTVGNCKAVHCWCNLRVPSEVTTATGKRAKRKSEAEHDETAKKAKSSLADAIKSGEKFTLKDAWSLLSASRYREDTDPIVYCEDIDEFP